MAQLKPSRKRNNAASYESNRIMNALQEANALRRRGEYLRKVKAERAGRQEKGA